MDTSRQQVFEYVRRQRTVTAIDLSRALGMTPANARHHLKILQDLELVVATTYKKQAGKGRPARVYRLSGKILGDNVVLLATVLLDELFDRTPSEDISGLLHKIAIRIAGKDDSQAKNMPMSQASRLFLAIQRLNQLNYQARWEARTNAPRLVFSNCPYTQIIEKSPVICAIDAELIHELVGLPTIQIDKLVLDIRGGRICVFQLGTTRTALQVSG